MTPAWFRRDAPCPDVRLARIAEWLDAGKYDRAADEARQLTEDACSAPALRPDDPTALAAAELWLEALGRAGLSEARTAAATRCLSLGVKPTAALRIAAAHYALIERRLDPEALTIYADALERGRIADAGLRRTLFHALSAGLYVGMDESPSRFDGRVALLTRLTARHPQAAFARLYLGRYAYLRGDFAGAAEHLGAIVGAAARSPKTLNLLGRSLEKLGRVGEAVAAYAASLAADRRQAAVHYRIGRLLTAEYVASLGRCDQ